MQSQRTKKLLLFDSRSEFEIITIEGLKDTGKLWPDSTKEIYKWVR